jgi:LysM repeat protein
MNNPHPINPLTPLAPGNKGNRNVRIAVISIVALHGVFFAGLLFQGCGPRTGETARKEPDNSFLTLTNQSYASATTLSNTPYADLTNWPGYATQYGAADPRAVPGATSTDLAATGAGNVGSGSLGTSTAGTGTAAGGTTGNVGAAVGGGGVTGTEALRSTETVTDLGEPAGALTTYKIKRGDTLAKIAAAHGITTKALMDANPGVEPKRLQVDKELKLPSAKKTASAGAATEDGFTLYTVQKGDTLSAIARKFGVTATEIRKANNLKSDTIMVDKKLKIPVPARAGGQG